MNGIFDTGLSFWQLVALICTVVAGLITIRISFKFDINRFLEDRRKVNQQKLVNVCSHLAIKPLGGKNFKAVSLFTSPPGTHLWQCQRCGLIRHQADADYMERAQYYLENIDEFLKENKRFRKLLKKSGQL